MDEILSMTEPYSLIPFADPAHEEIMIELYRLSALVWLGTFQEFQLTICETGFVESKGFIQPRGLEVDLHRDADYPIISSQQISVQKNIQAPCCDIWKATGTVDARVIAYHDTQSLSRSFDYYWYRRFAETKRKPFSCHSSWSSGKLPLPHMGEWLFVRIVPD